MNRLDVRGQENSRGQRMGNEVEARVPVQLRPEPFTQRLGTHATPRVPPPVRARIDTVRDLRIADSDHPRADKHDHTRSQAALVRSEAFRHDDRGRRQPQ